jgi:hypothetical protein
MKYEAMWQYSRLSKAERAKELKIAKELFKHQQDFKSNCDDMIYYHLLSWASGVYTTIFDGIPFFMYAPGDPRRLDVDSKGRYSTKGMDRKYFDVNA